MTTGIADITTRIEQPALYEAQPDVARTSVTDSRLDFDRIMSRLEPTREEKATEAARKLVSTAFLKPMFEMIEKDPLKSDLLHGGFGESAFRDHLHTVLRDRMVNGDSAKFAPGQSDSSVAFEELIGVIRDRILQAGGNSAYRSQASANPNSNALQEMKLAG